MSRGLAETERQELAAGIVEHLRFHSDRLSLPVMYQFRLPGDCFLSIEDAVIRQRRVLTCWVATGTQLAMAVAFITRARGASVEARWFEGASTKELARAMKELGRGIDYAYRNRTLNTVQRPFAAVLDPLAAPHPIDQPPPKDPGSWP